MNNHHHQKIQRQPHEENFIPLASRLRPNALSEFFGQQHLLGNDKPLYKAITQGQLHSMILWGPPGTGKTTLAKLMAKKSGAHFMTLSAVLDGVKDIRAVMEVAKKNPSTILFVDEVHRFNKSQQEAFLPFIEEGVVTFIGATTENPSFELVNALLSRVRVYVLKKLTVDELLAIFQRAIKTLQMDFPESLLPLLAQYSGGDARVGLNLLEICHSLQEPITEKLMAEVCAHSVHRFDKQGEMFHDHISALHKAVRGSSPDAALYWFCRMLEGGCDPLYLARRIVRMATEDVGNADPRALELALNAWDVQERLGSPEGELALAQAVVFISCAPKSNAVYTAFSEAKKVAHQTGDYEVPLHLRNAPTTLMKKLGYGKLYQYAHDYPDAYVPNENYFPEEFSKEKNKKNPEFYFPTNRGLEIKIKEKLAYLRKMDLESQS